VSRQEAGSISWVIGIILLDIYIFVPTIGETKKKFKTSACILDSRSKKIENRKLTIIVARQIQTKMKVSIGFREFWDTLTYPRNNKSTVVSDPNGFFGRQSLSGFPMCRPTVHIGCSSLPLLTLGPGTTAGDHHHHLAHVVEEAKGPVAPP
jgi:hypothetical protein